MRGQSTTARMVRTLAGVAFVTLVAAAAVLVSPAWSADVEVTIRATALEPSVLRVETGQRVNFVKRVRKPVHVEFGGDLRQHEVFQIPATGPIWAIFHRPGTHPYVVHIYNDGGKTTVLSGLVGVAENPGHPWGLGTCGAVVQGECIEP